MILLNELALKVKTALKVNEILYPKEESHDAHHIQPLEKSSISNSDSALGRLLHVKGTQCLADDKSRVEYLEHVHQWRKNIILIEDAELRENIIHCFKKILDEEKRKAHDIHLNHSEFPPQEKLFPLIDLQMALVTKQYKKVEQYLSTSSSVAVDVSKIPIIHPSKQNALHLATLYNDTRMAQILIKKKSVTKEDCHEPDIQGLTPLHLALYHSNLTMIQLLIREKLIEVNQPYLHGSTLLHFAAYTNNLPLCKVLLLYGADVNAINKLNGKTPLHYACQFNAPLVADHLLKQGASDKILNNHGETPAQIAVNWNAKDVVPLFDSLANHARKNDHQLCSTSTANPKEHEHQGRVRSSSVGNRKNPVRDADPEHLLFSNTAYRSDNTYYPNHTKTHTNSNNTNKTKNAHHSNAKSLMRCNSDSLLTFHLHQANQAKPHSKPAKKTRIQNDIRHGYH